MYPNSSMEEKPIVSAKAEDTHLWVNLKVRNQVGNFVLSWGSPFDILNAAVNARRDVLSHQKDISAPEDDGCVCVEAKDRR